MTPQVSTMSFTVMRWRGRSSSSFTNVSLMACLVALAIEKASLSKWMLHSKRPQSVKRLRPFCNSSPAGSNPGTHNRCKRRSFLYRTKSGRLILLWSSFGQEGYTEALAYSDNGDITGAWSQEDRLLFSKNGGHGMIFTGLDGELYLTLHSPNKKLEERPMFYRIREQNDTLYVE